MGAGFEAGIGLMPGVELMLDVLVCWSLLRMLTARFEGTFRARS
jgi:hypothetical protein